MSGFGQMVGASGNQQLSSIVSQGAEWGFTGATALTGNPAAIATLVFKTSALIIKEIQKHKLELKELAQKFNDLTMLQMQIGQVVITANTMTSYDKYGRVSFKDRK